MNQGNFSCNKDNVNVYFPQNTHPHPTTNTPPINPEHLEEQNKNGINIIIGTQPLPSTNNEYREHRTKDKPIGIVISNRAITNDELILHNAVLSGDYEEFLNSKILFYSRRYTLCSFTILLILLIVIFYLKGI